MASEGWHLGVALFSFGPGFSGLADTFNEITDKVIRVTSSNIPR